ncbi:MAG TPA: hypothetical protein VK745_22525 [Polyangiaceae bacterium]|nr:hypothetical protein [Polyangiaceae bacterium]
MTKRTRAHWGYPVEWVVGLASIQTAFGELSDAEQLDLYRARKQHKLCTVFLHELAHTSHSPSARS